MDPHKPHTFKNRIYHDVFDLMADALPELANQRGRYNDLSADDKNEYKRRLWIWVASMPLVETKG